jgi:hypothetical protein
MLYLEILEFTEDKLCGDSAILYTADVSLPRSFKKIRFEMQLSVLNICGSH